MALTNGAIVVATQDWHPEVTPHFAKDGGIWPVHCVADTWGAALHPDLVLPDDAPRVRKGVNGEDGYSGFTTRDPVTGDTTPTELEALLRDAAVERVVVVGLATDYCINATALDAKRLGFETAVLTDAIAAVNLKPADGTKAIDEMVAAGVTTYALGDAVIRGLIRLGLVGAGIGYAVDRLLAETAKGEAPEPIRSMVVIDAPIERVWDVLVDIEGQPRWMHDMKSVRIDGDGPGRRRDDRRGDGAHLRRRRHGPGDDHRVPAADAVRADPRRDVQGRRRVRPRGRRRRHDDHRPLGRDDHPAGPAAPRRDGRDAASSHRSSRRTSSDCATSSKARRTQRRLTDRPMRLHLVDATYELFRAHFAPRPPVLGRDGIPLSGVSGLCDQLLFLLREQGATHVGCATDRVIESFRNDLYPGYKSSAGMPPELLAQFPIAEAAIDALGIALWPMVEFEADDAIAAAAVRFAADPRVERILICTPDKDMAQLVVDERIVLWDRRRDVDLRRRRRPREVGRGAHLHPRLARPRRRLVGWVPGPARLGRQVGRRGPADATATTRTSRRRRRRGRSRASAARGRWPWRPPCATTGTRRCSIATWPASARPTTASRSARRTWTSCAGTARRAPSGRRSARNGASTGSGQGPIDGWPRTSALDVVERHRVDDGLDLGRVGVADRGLDVGRDHEPRCRRRRRSRFARDRRTAATSRDHRCLGRAIGRSCPRNTCCPCRWCTRRAWRRDHRPARPASSRPTSRAAS